MMFPREVEKLYSGKTEDELIDLQVRMAENLAKEIRGLRDIRELNTLSLLDLLGVCGLSLTISNIASKAFVSRLKDADETETLGLVERFVARNTAETDDKK
jgi:hypothetical protein